MIKKNSGYARVLLHAVNSQPMNFEKNLNLILQSILIAKETGCVYRGSTELELSAFGCEDHFFERDLTDNCWSCLSTILKFNKEIDNRNMIVEVGMPIEYEHNMYNCTVCILYDKIICIRSKENLCEEATYNEMRYFNGEKWNSLEESLIKKSNILDDPGSFLGRVNRRGKAHQKPNPNEAARLHRSSVRPNLGRIRQNHFRNE